MIFLVHVLHPRDFILMSILEVERISLEVDLDFPMIVIVLQPPHLHVGLEREPEVSGLELQPAACLATCLEESKRQSTYNL